MNYKYFICVILLATLGTASAMLFDEHGMCTPQLREQLKIIGFIPEQKYADFDPYHAVNVDAGMQKYFFKKDQDFYKNGGLSEHPLSYEQAQIFLDTLYAQQKETFPDQKENFDIIALGGVKPTLKISIKALRTLADSEYSFNKIFLCVGNEKVKEEFIKLANKEKNKSFFDAHPIEYIVADQELKAAETCFNKIKAISDIDKQLASHYVILDDPVFSGKIRSLAESIFQTQHRCVGTASLSTNDWKELMKIYGYNKILPDQETATIAYALSQLQFKARAVNSYVQLLNK